MSKDELRKYLYDYILQKDDLDDEFKIEHIIAYNKKSIYYLDSSGYVTTRHLDGISDSLILFTTFETKDYICKEYFRLEPLGGYHKYENEPVVLLYNTYNSSKSKNTIVYYISRLNEIAYDYLEKDDFDNKFTPDYTNDNFKLIDGI